MAKTKRKDLSAPERYLYQLDHVQTRALERYNLSLSPLDYENLNKAIESMDET
ncbi:UNVERIFIED_CONTAM: hypothetical protein HDU68_003235, partial [Siphonaria sp. JEL0065]